MRNGLCACSVKKPEKCRAEIRINAGSNPMKSKSVVIGSQRIFVLVLDTGEDAFRTISDFANEEHIDGASVSAIGAFEKARVGWFDVAAKTYKPIDVSEQCEVLNLLGDVARGDDGK